MKRIVLASIAAVNGQSRCLQVLRGRDAVNFLEGVSVTKQYAFPFQVSLSNRCYQCLQTKLSA